MAHVHDPREKRRQINRLSRVIGHLQFIKRLMEEDSDCSDVLMQLAAARSALNGLGKEIINEHMTHCVAHAIESGDEKLIEDFQEAIRRYM
ncbi:MAG: metal-sensing transcriptional repressor [bacterium]|nr:metal-sensing transcriptional repressor [bacterium]